MFSFLSIFLLSPLASAGSMDPSFAVVLAPPDHFWPLQLNFAAQILDKKDSEVIKKVRAELFTCLSSIMRERMSFENIRWAPWADYNLEVFMSLTDKKLANFLNAAPSVSDEAAFLIRLAKYVDSHRPFAHDFSCIPTTARLNMLEMSFSRHITAQLSVHNALVASNMFLTNKLVELYAVIDIYRLSMRGVSYFTTFVPDNVYYPDHVEVELDIKFFKTKISETIDHGMVVPYFKNKIENLVEKYSPEPKLPSLASVLSENLPQSFGPTVLSPLPSANGSPVDVTSVAAGGLRFPDPGSCQQVRAKRPLHLRKNPSFYEVLTGGEAPEQARKRARTGNPAGFFSKPLIENLRDLDNP